MPIFDNRGSYLFVKITEPYSLKWAFPFLREFAETCNREHLEKALIDGLNLEAYQHLGSISNRAGICQSRWSSN